ncbi:MAG: type I-U CRISPR-associated protein Csx17, partial [Planctomycetota bacterium]|nr:type I-U CRISPR-associated protein Csx17 [Planctomycetota bacterium]
MKMHRHILKGCQSRPLGSYLKALAVLRLVSEQADKSARGHWTEEGFVLHSRLDRRQLLDFFLSEYSPTPWLSPWNKGSGFFSKTDKGLSPIENSKAPRFEKFRRGIAEARAVAKAMDLAVQKENAIKGEAKAIKNKKERELYTNEEGYKKRLSAAERERKRAKDKLQRNCQQQWRGGALEWFRSATVLSDDNSPSFPAILGTGGNEGRLDYTNNAYQRLNELYCLEEKDAPPRSGVPVSLDHCLFNQTSQSLKKTPIGQFSPAAAGGANASSGPLGTSLVNPWELIFILEGSLLFRSSVGRRLTSRQMPQASAPFAVRSQGNGYASSAASDESSRGEQWVPLWEQPANLKEVSALLSEGRVQVKSRTATSSIDMARALSRLGVTRGLSSFERYAFMERNGQSNFAIPLGRWKVDPNPRSFLLDDLDRGSWLDKIRRSSRDDGAPGSFSVCTGRLLDSIFSVLGHPGEPARWQNVLIAMAQTEAQLVLSAQFTGKKRLAPIPRLSKGWVAASDDGSAEFRLALTLASSAKAWRHYRAVEPVRGHWLPLDQSDRQFKVAGESLINDPRVVMTGRDPGA